MGRVYLCLGQNAELPYYFEKAKVHIWNIEELCYFIRENAWVMEPELLTKELIDWVAQQCGLPKLAVLLNDSLKEEDCVTAFAACLSLNSDSSSSFLKSGGSMEVFFFF